MGRAPMGSAGGERRAAGGRLGEPGHESVEGLARVVPLELLVPPPRDDARPRVERLHPVDLDADVRVLPHHQDLAAFGGVPDDGAVVVGVGDRDDVRPPVCVATESGDRLLAKEGVDLVRGEGADHGRFWGVARSRAASSMRSRP